MFNFKKKPKEYFLGDQVKHHGYFLYFEEPYEKSLTMGFSYLSKDNYKFFYLHGDTIKAYSSYYL